MALLFQWAEAISTCLIFYDVQMRGCADEQMRGCAALQMC
jgi:hypothetical protein